MLISMQEATLTPKKRDTHQHPSILCDRVQGSSVSPKGGRCPRDVECRSRPSVPSLGPRQFPNLLQPPWQNSSKRRCPSSLPSLQNCLRLSDRRRRQRSLEIYWACPRWPMFDGLSESEVEADKPTASDGAKRPRRRCRFPNYLSTRPTIVQPLEDGLSILAECTEI
jgi:hypothetical protein